MNPWRLALSILLSSIAFAQTEVLPPWSKDLPGWSLAFSQPQRLILKYKTGAAFLMVTESFYDLDEKSQGVFASQRHRQEALNSRQELWQALGLTAQIQVGLAFDHQLTGDIRSQMNAQDREILIAERIWTKDKRLWHIVFSESSSRSIDPDDYQNAVGMIYDRINKEAQVVSSKESVLWRLITSQEKLAFAEVGETAATQNQSFSPSEASSLKCSSYEIADQYRRSGEPKLDLHLDPKNLGPACAQALEKTKDLIGNIIAQFVQASFAVPEVDDLPQCHSLKPKKTDPADPFCPLCRYYDWSTCVKDAQLGQKAHEFMHSATDARTYAGAFTKTADSARTSYEYLVHPTIPMAALGNYLADQKTGFACLKAEQQEALACKAALEVSTLVGAAGVCSVITKGKCLTTATEKIKNLMEELMAQFKRKPAPPPPAEAAAPNKSLSKRALKIEKPAIHELQEYFKQTQDGEIQIINQRAHIKIYYLDRRDSQLSKLLYRAVSNGEVSDINAGLVIGPKVMDFMTRLRKITPEGSTMKIHGKLSAGDFEQKIKITRNNGSTGLPHADQWTDQDVQRYNQAIETMGLKKACEEIRKASLDKCYNLKFEFNAAHPELTKWTAGN